MSTDTQEHLADDWDNELDPRRLLLKYDVQIDSLPFRKPVLVGCAIVRRLWKILHDKRSTLIVEGMEAFMHRASSDKSYVYTEAARKTIASLCTDAYNAYTALCDSRRRDTERYEGVSAATAAYTVVCLTRLLDSGELQAHTYRAHNLRMLVSSAWPFRVDVLEDPDETEIGAITRAMGATMKNILGNPFRCIKLPPGLNPCKACKGKGSVPAGAGGAVDRPHRVPCERCASTGRTKSPVLTPEVLGMAQFAYSQPCGDDGVLNNEPLLVLSDALEDTGYDMPEILEHLRSPGPHHKGMWSLDLLVCDAAR